MKGFGLPFYEVINSDSKRAQVEKTENLFASSYFTYARLAPRREVFRTFSACFDNGTHIISANYV